MKVKKVDSQRSEDDKSSIFQHCYVLMIVGAVASGKTSLLISMFTSKEFYKQNFSRIVFLSVTARLDAKVKQILDCPDICVSNQKLQDRIDYDYSQLDENHVRTILPKYHGIEQEDIHESYTPEILQKLIDEQQFVISEYGKEYSDSVCLIIDDAITSGIYQGRMNQFCKFVCTLRHLNCSVIHMNQSYKSANKIIRSQSTAGIFFATNELELRDIYEVFNCNYSLHKWLEIFSIVTNKPFNPIVFNLHNRKGYKIQNGFNGEFVG